VSGLTLPLVLCVA